MKNQQANQRTNTSTGAANHEKQRHSTIARSNETAGFSSPSIAVKRHKTHGQHVHLNKGENDGRDDIL